MSYAKTMKYHFVAVGEEAEFELACEPDLGSFKGRDIYLMGPIVWKHVSKFPVFGGRTWTLCKGKLCGECRTYKQEPRAEVQDIPIVTEYQGKKRVEFLYLPLHGYMVMEPLIAAQAKAGRRVTGMKVKIKRSTRQFEVEVTHAPEDLVPKDATTRLVLDSKEKEDLKGLAKQIRMLGALDKKPTKEEYIEVLVQAYAWGITRAKTVVELIYHEGKLEV